MKARLTKALIEGAKQDRKQLFIWDSEVRGLGIRITQGSRSFVLQYHRDGRDHRVTLGPYGPASGGLNVEQARQLAASKRLELRTGAHPAEANRQARQAPKVRDLAERFQVEHAAVKCRESTARAYGKLWNMYINPALGGLRVPEVTSREVAALHHSMRRTPVVANRTLSLLRKAFSLAVRWGWYPENRPNPARGHDPHPERRRGQALSPEQLAGIGAIIEEEGPSLPCSAFLVPLLTGCRPGEALALKWADLDGRLWRLEEGKTGARVVYLGSAVVRVLDALPRSSEWVFPGRVSGSHLESTRKFWLRIRGKVAEAVDAGRLPEEARLPDGIRPYDCTRHTHTTFCEELGIERERRKVLAGHAVDRDVTERYVHRRAESLLRDADLVSETIAAALRGDVQPQGKVLDLEPRSRRQAQAVAL